MRPVKRWLCILLAAALLASLSGAAPAFGEAAQGGDVSMYPVIRVEGGWHELYINEGTDEEETVFNMYSIFSMDTFAFLLEDFRDPDVEINKDYFEDAIIRVIENMYGAVRMDSSGNSADPGITRKRTEEWRKTPTGGDECSFTFDWRLDPWDNAETLRECILNSGSEKVNLVCVSSAGPVMLAYLERYGTDKLASAVFTVSTHAGSSVFGGLATMRFRIDPLAMGNTNLMEVFNAGFTMPVPLLRVAYELGIMDLAARYLDSVTYKHIDRIYAEAVVPYMFLMPGHWAYVPAGDYEEAKRLLLKGDPRYDALVEKIDRYHAIVLRQDELLRETASQVKTAVLVGYGMPLLGIAEGTYTLSDNFVDTAYASFGATCAPLGQPFPAAYAQQVPGSRNYISPDRMVDASTCALPEQTWFASNLPHRRPVYFPGWYDWFLRAEGDYSVRANPAFPQFMERLSPDEYIPLTAKRSRPVMEFISGAFLKVLELWRYVLLDVLLSGLFVA